MREPRRVLLDDVAVLLDRRVGLAVLGQLAGDVEPQVEILGAELDDPGQLGPGLCRLSCGRVVIGQRPVDLDGVRRLLELFVGACR